MTRARGLFVTGTDTGVGKTLIACALAAWCRRRGLEAGVMKPVATGGVAHDGRWVSDDAIRLAQASGSRDPWPLINPVCFREPLAPWTAARRTRHPIRLDAILEAFHTLAERHERLIVEGAGGLLVPLTDEATMADLVDRFGLALVIVSRSGLGTLNHTLLTLQCAQRRRLRMAGILINQARPSAREPMARLAERTNPSALGRLTHVPVFGPLPYVAGWSRHKPLPDALAAWISHAVGDVVLNRMIG